MDDVAHRSPSRRARLRRRLSAVASSSPAGQRRKATSRAVRSLDPRRAPVAGAPAAPRAAVQPRAGRCRRDALRDRRLPRRPRASRRVRPRAALGSGAAARRFRRPTHAFGAVAFRGGCLGRGRPPRRAGAARGVDPRPPDGALATRARRCRGPWSSSASPCAATSCMLSGSRRTRCTTRHGSLAEGPPSGRDPPRALAPSQWATSCSRSPAVRRRSATLPSWSGSGWSSPRD